MGTVLSLREIVIVLVATLLVPPVPVGGPAVLVATRAKAVAADAEREVIVPAAPARHALRVMAYNIHHGRGLDGRIDLARIAGVITEAKADLVVLNEVDQKTRRSSGVDQPAELARLTGLHVAFEKNIDFQGGAYGNAILSRYPIRSVRNHHLPTMTTGEQRGCLEVVVDIEQEGVVHPLRLLGTHFDYRPRDAERVASVQQLLKYLEDAPEMPTLLAGDLNDTPDSRTLTLLGQEFQNADGELRLTYPAAEPTKQIDFVLHRPAQRFAVTDSRVLGGAGASDHRPLLVRLDLLLPR